MRERRLRGRTNGWVIAPMLLFLICCACSNRDNPTRTPVPTFTPTPPGAAPAAPAQEAVAPTNVVEVVMPTATTTDTPVPPTATATAIPSDTPSPAPTPTLTATPTVAPTIPPTPDPTATPAFSFSLEEAEKYPTTSLAPNVVRVFLFVADADGFALPDYSLRVVHNGAVLPVDKVSTAGVPGLTRGEPSPYTRFTNLTAIFVEGQAGTWEIQLVDQSGNPVGPPAEFDLTDEEDTRELYVRYEPVTPR